MRGGVVLITECNRILYSITSALWTKGPVTVVVHLHQDFCENLQKAIMEFSLNETAARDAIRKFSRNGTAAEDAIRECFRAIAGNITSYSREIYGRHKSLL